MPGDHIGEGFVAGHGTFVAPDTQQIYASIAGVVHMQDRVICVKPIRSYYRPDVGDVIVGRIVSVDHGRWLVDVNSYQHAVLNLTAINLPGGVQRRRDEEDKLHMREFFQEGDLISGEIQQVGTFDGKIMIQTRNQKYGLLKNGVLLKVDNNKIRRMKNHMMEFFSEPSIGLIIGTNGYVWIEALRKGKTTEPITEKERIQIAVLRNAIMILDQAKIPIFKDTILKVIEEQ